MNKDLNPTVFKGVTDTSYLSPALFCTALLKLYQIIYLKYQSFSDPKNDFIWQLHHWCNILILLTQVGTERNTFVEKALKRVEASEISLLSDWRNSQPFTSFSLQDERLVYKTLKNLF